MLGLPLPKQIPRGMDADFGSGAALNDGGFCLKFSELDLGIPET